MDAAILLGLILATVGIAYYLGYRRGLGDADEIVDRIFKLLK